MTNRSDRSKGIRNRLFFSRLLAMACASLLFLQGCQRNTPIAVAVIPRTSGSMLWEPEHGGAETAGAKLGARIYWNAPTREDDVAGQIALVERVSNEDYQGLVLAPDQARALMTPVRRAMERGLSIVVIGSPLPMPPSGRLAYILNDEEAGGRIAGQRVAELLKGRGSVAILGIDSDIAGIVTRARSLEQYLEEHYPRIRVVKRSGSFNFPHEQQVAEETLKANPDLDAVATLTSTSTLSALSALGNIRPSRRINVVAFDQDSLAFDNPNLDSVVLQDTPTMGAEAIQLIVDKLHGRSTPGTTNLEPVLATRENVNSEEVRRLTSMEWRPAPLVRAWRRVQ